jgi:transcriptional regulator with XRE-family HTH domain
MGNLREELKAAGVRQVDLAAATGETEASVSRRLHGLQPMTGNLEAAARRLIRQAKIERARKGLAAAQELLGGR